MSVSQKTRQFEAGEHTSAEDDDLSAAQGGELQGSEVEEGSDGLGGDNDGMVSPSSDGLGSDDEAIGVQLHAEVRCCISSAQIYMMRIKRNRKRLGRRRTR